MERIIPSYKTLRQILIYVVSILYFTSCSESEEITMDKELLNMSAQSLFFTFSKDKPFNLETKNGAKIFIDANTFIFSNGGFPEDSIQIEVKEVYDQSEMVLNGISTTSEGQLLESFGMIYIKASSGNKELKIQADKTIKVSIPNKIAGNKGELFYGEQTDSILNWRIAETNQNMTVKKEIITALPNDRGAFVRREVYKLMNRSRVLISDTSFTINSFEYQALNDTTNIIPAPLESYEFNIEKLGWINCDRFIDVTEKVDLNIELKKFNQPFGYILFDSINSVMPIVFNNNGEARLINMPKNYTVHVIVIDNIKGDLMWVKTPFKISSKSKITLETKKIGKEELKGAIAKLDK